MSAFRNEGRYEGRQYSREGPRVVAYGMASRSTTQHLVPAFFGVALLAAACGGGPPGGEGASDGSESDPQLVFWDELQDLCGGAYAGRLEEAVPPDHGFAAADLVMHAHYCDIAEVRIGFHVGENRSRTWVITPTAAGLELRHDHRHEDGSPDAITMYGGESRGIGTETAQDFPADARTAEMVPEAATNVWTVELHPDSAFVYALRRDGSDRRFRVSFDLTRAVEPPPPPWGWSR